MLCHPGLSGSPPKRAAVWWGDLSRDPVSGVAKSVCHRDRRYLPNRQLRCLCRTDFGSPIRGSPEGWQNPFATETGGLFQTGNSVASAEQISAARYRGNPRLLSALICVNRLTRDPVFSGSFEVRAGFGIGGIYTAFIAGLNSKRPASMEFKEPFQTVKVPQTFWALWTLCGITSHMGKILV